MNDAKQELESELEKMPELQHVGLALMQYIQAGCHNKTVIKNPLGGYRFAYGRGIGLQISAGREIILFTIIGFKSADIGQDLFWMLPPKTSEMRLTDNEGGFACFEVSHAAHLGQATVYIRKAQGLNLTTRMIPPYGLDHN
jgi:hypothetical protein